MHTVQNTERIDVSLFYAAIKKPLLFYCNIAPLSAELTNFAYRAR